MLDASFSGVAVGFALQPFDGLEDAFWILVLQPDDVVARFLQRNDEFVQLRVHRGGVAIALNQDHTCDDDGGD